MHKTFLRYKVGRVTKHDFGKIHGWEHNHLKEGLTCYFVWNVKRYVQLWIDVNTVRRLGDGTVRSEVVYSKINWISY